MNGEYIQLEHLNRSEPLLELRKNPADPIATRAAPDVAAMLGAVLQQSGNVFA